MHSPPHELFLVTTTILCLVGVTAGADEMVCHDRSQLDECMQQLPQLVSSERGIPSTKREVDVACSAFKTGMQCIDRYAELCLGAKERKIMNENVAGARHTFSYLCDDPLFQSEYLQFASCYRSVSQDWDMCAERFQKLVRAEARRAEAAAAGTAAAATSNLTAQQRTARLCCAKDSFLQCVEDVSNLKCRKDAADFLHRIAETLSNVRVYSTACRSLGITDPCSQAAPFVVASHVLVLSVILVALLQAAPLLV